MLKNQPDSLTAHTVTYHDGTTDTIHANDFDGAGYQSIFFDEEHNTVATVMNANVRSIVRDPAAPPLPPETREPASMPVRAVALAVACAALWVALTDWFSGL